jgi:lipooligosaccharide transport system ATP-binding protein
VVSARGVVKTFGDFRAVDGIDVEVRPGEVFGFLGPNGAGKSSTMRMIACVSPVSAGELRVLGGDPDRDGPRIRARLGVVPQEDALDTELTVGENLLVYGRYFDLPRSVIAERTGELLDLVQLTDRRGSLVDALSGGMKRRLTIARALVNEPEMVLLDEPTTGLDPQARHVIWERLWSLKQRGVTQILTTHYMDEAEQLCDRLVVMDHGSIVAEGAPRALITEWSTPEVVELRWNDPDVDLEVQQKAVRGPLGDDVRAEVLADRILVYAANGDSVVGHLSDHDVRADSVLVRRSTLEDVFLRLTGRTLVD